MSESEKFGQLCALVKETAYLKSTLASLEWDQQTYMPVGAGAFRAEQITFLAGEIHRRETDQRVGDLLGELSSSDLAADNQSDSGATITGLKREYDKKIKLPESLVKAQAKASAIGQQVWIDARKNDDFKSFEPNLNEIFNLKKEQAEAVGYEECPYDALLDDFEPHAKTSEVAAALEGLRQELVPLVAAISESSSRPDTSVLKRNYPTEAQRRFGREASEKIGFDYTRGRLDVTHHPFCTELGPGDVRITTRFDESFFNTSFFGTLHEAGHGIYEQGLRTDFYGLPPGAFCSLGIHESQSRLWENLVGRSEGFWNFFYTRAVEIFPGALADVQQHDFYKAINNVQPSLIRVEADEATYDLHIIIRFQIEQAIINGELEIADLPGAWNEKYEQYLGITPPDDANGCLQDIHWSAGLVGYFPTYSLGNLHASQMYEAAEKELGNLQGMFSDGNFSPLRKWLNENVHQRGQTLTAQQLGEKVSGTKLSQEALMRHLNDKLAPIYALSPI
ncbi:MAG: carboxypeptidase M32 [Planctomycetota bacterium]